MALLVVRRIQASGGRFLKRHGTNPQGDILYVDIGLSKAQEKTSQALRENAPELRRRKTTGQNRGGIANLSSSSTLEGIGSPGKGDGQYKAESMGSRALICTSSFDKEESNDGVLAIEPSMIMLGRKHSPAISLPVDQLKPSEREIYMNHFYPPNSALEAKQKYLRGHKGSNRARDGMRLRMGVQENTGKSFKGSHVSQEKMPEEAKSGIVEWPSISVPI